MSAPLDPDPESSTALDPATATGADPRAPGPVPAGPEPAEAAAPSPTPAPRAEARVAPEAPPALEQAEGADAAPGGFLDRHAGRLDATLYAAFACAAVVYVAHVFYGSMHAQTGGSWSAPLDDVFIHFDYARAIARGYPFQWSEGNGYSSGNTSLTYPFVLALGYWVGFRGLSVMVWAAIVATVSTVAFLLGAARLLDVCRPPLPAWCKYLLPPAVLGLGALDWTLFSGMENAFHLAMWSACAVSAAALVMRADDAGAARRLGWLTGATGALLFATRPESVACVATFGVWAALVVRRRHGAFAAVATLLRVGLPGAVAVVLQAVANRAFTGEWSANGAIAKLALNNPYMTGAEKLDEYLHFLKYVVLRNTQHHFSDALPWGWMVPLLALVPVLVRSTRALAVVLWAQVIGWSLLVSLNGQVRWQNERYTMAGVAWLLLLAGLGVALLLRPLPSMRATWPRPWRGERAWQWALSAAVALGAVALFAVHQAPNMRDQVWFFGRASRNILDQHVTAGVALARMNAKRVLVGDAGALLYASDRPGLDLIGLGGYHDLPFARAAVHGLGASLELVERMPREERPDVMAIYPSWWGDLPSVFGRRIEEYPVVGNVICGDVSKVIYGANWSSLDRAGKPRLGRAAGDAELTVVDEVDVADLVSERAHAYEQPRPSAGFVAWRVLADPDNPARDLFDAGRVVPPGRAERFRIRVPRSGGALRARTVVTRPARVEVRIDGKPVGALAFASVEGWQEVELELPLGLPGEVQIELSASDEWTNHHVWTVERR